jgi:AcrR family transcriptional regulator
MTHLRMTDVASQRAVRAANRPAGQRRSGPRAAALPSNVRREQILDRALDLVPRGGLGGLTMKKIAARVRFSEAAIYRHFPTRQLLLLGLMDRLETMLLGPIRAIAADTGVAPAERLTRILRHHTTVVVERDSLPILLLAEASVSGDARLVGRMREIFSAYLEILRRLVAEAGVTAARPTAPDSTDLALLLVGLPAAVAIHHRLSPDAPAERALADTLAPFLVRCITSVGSTRS